MNVAAEDSNIAHSRFAKNAGLEIKGISEGGSVVYSIHWLCINVYFNV